MNKPTTPPEETPEVELPEIEVPEIEVPEPTQPEAADSTLPEVLDPEPDIASGPNPDDLIGLLQENLALTKQLEEARRGEMYAQAEYQNFRRRSDERYAEERKYKNADFIKDLLPVVDNFERAMAAAETSQNFEALISGVKGTLKQLQTALEKAGVTPIEAIGKEFDPKFHEAIGHAESDEYPSNTVAEELQRGYILHERVLRPSMVRVTD